MDPNQLRNRISRNPSEERFRSEANSVVSLGENSSLVYSGVDRSAQIIPRNLAVLLDRCRTFRTLDEHAHRIADFFAQKSCGTELPAVDLIKQHLSTLVDRGLLISEIAVLEACRSSNEGLQRISSVGVITRNRIDSLERCLRSYIESDKRYGRTSDFVIVDDSETTSARAKTKEMLLLLKRRFDVSLSYAGLEEKSRFADLLVSEGGFDPDLVRFALIASGDHEFSCGKNRNALFLHTVGDLVFSTDDDAVCRVAAPPQCDPDREQEPRGQPLTPIEFWFFANREEALQSEWFVEEDPLSGHEQLLGRRVADCILSFGDLDLLSWERPISHLLRSIESDHGRVLVTLSGMIGDSGMRVPVTYKVLRPASRERLIETKESYTSGCSSREVMRVSTRYCLSNRTWFVSTALGYDNRELLPPFFPVLRGTDGIFAATVGRCYEHGYIGDIPRAILHAPTPPRRYERAVIIRSATGNTMHSLIIACILSRQFSPGFAGGADRMRALGRHLVEIGSMSLPDFEEFARIHLWREKANMLANLEKDLLDYQTPPDYWADDLKHYLAATRASLTKPEFAVPQDLRMNRSLEQSRELSRDLVSSFGKLLCAWPNMIEAAKALRAKGERLAQHI